MKKKHRYELRKLYLVSRIDTFFWEEESTFKLTDFDHDTENELVLVAIKNNKILGFISLYLEDNFIHNLFVLPEKKGMGVGTSLMKEVQTILKKPMKLKCLSRNKDALKFYESKGWKKIDEVKFENENKNYWNLRLN